LAIPNEEQNEESENEENQPQNDEHHHQMQTNEEIDKNSNEISESDALKICFGNFADDDEEEEEADSNDSHHIQVIIIILETRILRIVPNILGIFFFQLLTKYFCLPLEHFNINKN
jgi:hypothetical protein